MADYQVDHEVTAARWSLDPIRDEVQFERGEFIDMEPCRVIGPGDPGPEGEETATVRRGEVVTRVGLTVRPPGDSGYTPFRLALNDPGHHLEL